MNYYDILPIFCNCILSISCIVFLLNIFPYLIIEVDFISSDMWWHWFDKPAFKSILPFLNAVNTFFDPIDAFIKSDFYSIDDSLACFLGAVFKLNCSFLDVVADFF